VLTGWTVVLILKIAVTTVTVILLLSLIPLVMGNYRLHGRINMAFFGLTLSALVGLEVVSRIINPQLFDYFNEATRRILAVHLSFSLPAALLLPVMLYTGLTHRRTFHLVLAAIFSLLWTGTVVTGVFFLPHSAP
jgi:hypothetical protein